VLPEVPAGLRPTLNADAFALWGWESLTELVRVKRVKLTHLT